MIRISLALLFALGAFTLLTGVAQAASFSGGTGSGGTGNPSWGGTGSTYHFFNIEKNDRLRPWSGVNSVCSGLDYASGESPRDVDRCSDRVLNYMLGTNTVMNNQQAQSWPHWEERGCALAFNIRSAYSPCWKYIHSPRQGLASGTRGKGTVAEIHAMNPSGTSVPNNAQPAPNEAPIGISVTVWRHSINPKYPDLGNPRDPIFARTLAIRPAKNGNWTDDGGSTSTSCNGNTTPTGNFSYNGCVSQGEWWYGGDGYDSNGVGGVGGNWSTDNALAGPLRNATSGENTACVNKWDVAKDSMRWIDWADLNEDGLLDEAGEQAPDGRRELQDGKNNAYRYVNGNLATIPGAFSMCTWALRDPSSGARLSTFPVQYRKNNAVGTMNVQPRITLTWQINTTNTYPSPIDYRIEGEPGVFYLVHIAVFNRMEGGARNSFRCVSAGGQNRCDNWNSSTPNSSDYIQVFLSSQTFEPTPTEANVALPGPFPGLSAALTTPSHRMTVAGERYDLRLDATTIPQSLSHLQALWPMQAGVAIGDPQVNPPYPTPWPTLQEGMKLQGPSALSRAEQSASAMGMGACLPGATPVNSWTNPALAAGPWRPAPSGRIWSQNYQMQMNVVSRSDNEPACIKGHVWYESGRYVRLISVNDQGQISRQPKWREQQIRASKAGYDLDVRAGAPSTQVLQAAIYPESACGYDVDKNGNLALRQPPKGTGAKRCQQFTFSFTGDPNAVRRIELQDSNNPSRVETLWEPGVSGWRSLPMAGKHRTTRSGNDWVVDFGLVRFNATGSEPARERDPIIERGLCHSPTVANCNNLTTVKRGLLNIGTQGYIVRVHVQSTPGRWNMGFRQWVIEWNNATGLWSNWQWANENFGGPNNNLDPPYLPGLPQTLAQEVPSSPPAAGCGGDCVAATAPRTHSVIGLQPGQ